MADIEVKDHGEEVAKPIRLSYGLWLLFAAVCIFYAVLAFDYFLFGSDRVGLWLQFLTFMVSAEYATGVGSLHLEQAKPYSDGFIFLLPHTMFGAIALAIGPFQFMSFIRCKYPALHRNMGKIYLISVLISMVTGLAYLITTPLGDVFSGRPFAIALIGLDLLVLTTAYLAYSEIRGGRVIQHQAWMAFNFSLILVTPIHRVFWITLAWMLPHYNQAEANIGILTYLLPFCLLFGMVWYSIQNARREVFADKDNIR